jgi:hypothetical protein
MPNFLSNTVGLLLNNPSPLPDGTVGSANIQTVAAAGTTQATAAALPAPVNIISNNTATNGVILPVGTINQAIVVIPSLATNAPLVYPPVGGTVNFGAANVAAAAPARRQTSFRAIDSTGLNWVSDSLTA